MLPHLDAGYNLARWLCRDSDLAQDIVQEATSGPFGSSPATGAGMRGPGT